MKVCPGHMVSQDFPCERMDAFIVAAHERGDQLLIVDGDGCAFYRGNPPEHDVAAWTGEQRCAMWRLYIAAARSPPASDPANK